MNLDARLRGVVAAVFGVDVAKVVDADSPRSIPQWDSVGHLDLLLAIEAEFGVQFTPDEMAAMVSIGAIRQRLKEAVHG